MTIDPALALPTDTAVEVTSPDGARRLAYLAHDGCTKPTPRSGAHNSSDEIARVFVPVPDGMTAEDAEAALADAGAWVEVGSLAYLPSGARVRREWRNREGGSRYYVHRDDLPTDPDAELVEKMARGIRAVKGYEDPWDNVVEDLRENYRVSARAALAVVREHEAKS